MPICISDNIKIAFNFFSMNGLTDLSSVQWLHPIIEEIPNLNGKFDLNRVCEVEEINNHWTLFEFYQRKEKVSIDKFQPYLIHKETKCAGVDSVIMKMIYYAAKKGKL